ncbi:MAG: hypothetical protein RR312_01675, partial [Bacteroidales bacterium]
VRESLRSTRESVFFTSKVSFCLICGDFNSFPMRCADTVIKQSTPIKAMNILRICFINMKMS